jgi:hypothetical protein
MKEPLPKPNQLNPLAAEMSRIIERATPPPGLELAVVDDGLAAAINARGINIDYRPRLYQQDCAPAQLGAEFDPDAVRTQTATLLDARREPVAVMTLVIEPKFWLQRQRYLVREPESFRVATLADVLRQGDAPDFAVGPGWTYAQPEYRNQFGRLGVTLMMQLLAAAADAAPTGTWFMASAAGPLPFEQREVIAELWERPVGSPVQPGELPVTATLVGTPRCESRATAKFAQLLGWEQIEGVADQNTLGPVFAKPAG